MTISTEIAIKRSVEHSTAIQTINILHRVKSCERKFGKSTQLLLNLQQNLHVIFQIRWSMPDSNRRQENQAIFVLRPYKLKTFHRRITTRTCGFVFKAKYRIKQIQAEKIWETSPFWLRIPVREQAIFLNSKFNSVTPTNNLKVKTKVQNARLELS